MENRERPQAKEDWGLIVVDMQNDFLSEAGYYARRRELDGQVERGELTMSARNQLLTEPGSAPPGAIEYRSASLSRVVRNVSTVVELARAQRRPIVYLQAVYSREFAVQPPFLRHDQNREHFACKPHTWGAAFVEPIQQLIDAKPPDADEIVIAKHTFDGFHETDLLRFLRERNIQSVVVVGVETHVCVLTTAQSAAILQFPTTILEDCTWTGHETMAEGALAIFRDAFGSTALVADIL